MIHRLICIDYIKFLAVCLVVYYHSGAHNILSWGLLSTGVPLFFCVNGFLMLRKNYDMHTVVKSALKMYILYFFWGFIKALAYSTSDNKPFGINDLIHLVKCEDGYGYWFLLTMAILYLLYPILRDFVHVKRNYRYLLLIVGLCSIQFVELPFRKIAPFSGWHSYALLYYLLGFYILSKDFQPARKVIAISFMSLLIALLLQFFLNCYFLTIPYDVKLLLYMAEPVTAGYRSLFVVIATCSIVLLLKYFKNHKYGIILLISKHSLGIYIIQDLILTFIRPMDEFKQLGIFSPMIVVLLCTLICYLLSLSKVTHWFITTKL